MAMNDALLLGAITIVSFVLAFYGAAAGLILGHLRLPLLGYYLPSAASASATNLAISGLGALTGTIRHACAGRISLRVLALMGIPSVAGAVLGAWVMLKVDADWARIFVGGFLMVSGVNLVYSHPEEGGTVLFNRGLRMALEILIGLALGFLAVVTGLMMGSMRLPMMIKWLRIDPRVAVGSNMAVGCLTAFAGVISFWSQGKEFHLTPLLIIAPPTILGGWLGAKWTGKIRKESLALLVGWMVAGSGLVMVGEGLWRSAAKWLG